MNITAKQFKNVVEAGLLAGSLEIVGRALLGSLGIAVPPVFSMVASMGVLFAGSTRGLYRKRHLAIGIPALIMGENLAIPVTSGLQASLG